MTEGNPIHSPTYIVALVAELSLCLWLLIKGVKVDEWKKRSIANHSNF